MHIHETDVDFHVGLPARRANLSRQDHGSVMLGPGRKIPIQCRVDPILVFRDRHLAVVRRDGLCHSAEVSQRVVVDADPVGDVTAGHAFRIEIAAVGQRSHEYSHSGSDLRVVSVTEPQGFPCVIQLQVDAGIPLNMERCIPTAKPICVTPAILTVAQRSLAFYLACGVVFLPQVLQRLTLSCERTVDLLRVKLPIQLGFSTFPGLAVQALRDEFVGYVLRQRVGQLLAFPESLQKFVHRCFAVSSDGRDLSAAHSVREMQHQNSFVVHFRTSSMLDSSLSEVYPL